MNRPQVPPSSRPRAGTGHEHTASTRRDAGAPRRATATLHASVAGTVEARVARRGASTAVTVAVTIATLAATLAFPAVAQPAPPAPGAPERGRALYETRCIACHERSVHQREARRATDFASLRAEVARWSATSGGEWRDEEIDAVSAYLNERYYRFACPPAICRSPARAGGATPPS